MKILVLADIDEFHWKYDSGDVDIVISCGDIADQTILEAAAANNCQTIFAVKGNHDSSSLFPAPIIDLHLQYRQYHGLTFGGLNGSWKYKHRGNFLYDQEEVEDFLSNFPSVDIFFSHNSPRRVHDKEDEIHYGFVALNAYIKKSKPKILIHGHQHINKETNIQDTRVIGVYGHKIIDI